MKRLQSFNSCNSNSYLLLSLGRPAFPVPFRRPSGRLSPCAGRCRHAIRDVGDVGSSSTTTSAVLRGRPRAARRSNDRWGINRRVTYGTLTVGHATSSRRHSCPTDFDKPYFPLVRYVSYRHVTVLWADATQCFTKCQQYQTRSGRQIFEQSLLMNAIFLRASYIVYTVSQKTVQNCFCQNFVKFPPVLIIFRSCLWWAIYMPNLKLLAPTVPRYGGVPKFQKWVMWPLHDV